MKKFLLALAVAAQFSLAVGAHAQTRASNASAVSALPLASVVASGTVLAVPVMLSEAGAGLVVKSVEASGRGTVYVLERVSDGARASIEVVGHTVAASAVGVGTAVSVSVVAAGVMVSAAGQVLAFIPNALGEALLYNQRLTH